MRALIVTPEVKAKIQRVVAWATENPVSVERLRRMATAQEKPVGDDPRFAVVVPVGYRCVFSMEEQPTLGLSRHLSVSVPTPRKLPSPEAMATLMGAFGFSRAFCATVQRGDALGAHPTGGGVWLEEGRAVNVVEKAS